jgi:hypothetical protein
MGGSTMHGLIHGTGSENQEVLSWRGGIAFVLRQLWSHRMLQVSKNNIA